MNDVKKIAVMSLLVPKISAYVKSKGYNLIHTDCVECFIDYEQYHADMQCFIVDDTAFVLSVCDNLSKQLENYGYNIIKCGENINGDYPNNICLNAKIIGNYLLGKIDCLAPELLSFCINNGYKTINVNQGYAACSTIAVDNNSAITADTSIYKALTEQGIDVLKISEGNIELVSADNGEYGFIGGASMRLEDMLLFFGDITKHPDYIRMKKFCEDRNVKIDYIDNLELSDIGGCIC